MVSLMGVRRVLQPFQGSARAVLEQCYSRAGVADSSSRWKASCD